MSSMMMKKLGELQGEKCRVTLHLETGCKVKGIIDNIFEDIVVVKTDGGTLYTFEVKRIVMIEQKH